MDVNKTKAGIGCVIIGLLVGLSACGQQETDATGATGPTKTEATGTTDKTDITGAAATNSVTTPSAAATPKTTTGEVQTPTAMARPTLEKYVAAAGGRNNTYDIQGAWLGIFGVLLLGLIFWWFERKSGRANVSQAAAQYTGTAGPGAATGAAVPDAPAVSPAGRRESTRNPVPRAGSTGFNRSASPAGAAGANVGAVGAAVAGAAVAGGIVAGSPGKSSGVTPVIRSQDTSGPSLMGIAGMGTRGADDSHSDVRESDASTSAANGTNVGSAAATGQSRADGSVSSAAGNSSTAVFAGGTLAAGAGMAAAAATGGSARTTAAGQRAGAAGAQAGARVPTARTARAGGTRKPMGLASAPGASFYASGSVSVAAGPHASPAAEQRTALPVPVGASKQSVARADSSAANGSAGSASSGAGNAQPVVGSAISSTGRSGASDTRESSHPADTSRKPDAPQAAGTADAKTGQEAQLASDSGTGKSESVLGSGPAWASGSNNSDNSNNSGDSNGSPASATGTASSPAADSASGTGQTGTTTSDSGATTDTGSGGQIGATGSTGATDPSGAPSTGTASSGAGSTDVGSTGATPGAASKSTGAGVAGLAAGVAAVAGSRLTPVSGRSVTRSAGNPAQRSGPMTGNQQDATAASITGDHGDDSDANARGRPADHAADQTGEATSAGSDDLTRIKGIGGKTAGLLRRKGIKRYADLAAWQPADLRRVLDDGGPMYASNDPSSWPAQARLAQREDWAALEAFRTDGSHGAAPSGAGDAHISARASATDGRSATASAPSTTAVSAGTGAHPASTGSAKGDDLTRVNGIGPKVAEVLHKGDVRSFRALSDTPVPKLQGLLDAAGNRFAMADPSTWPAQAKLAADGQWDALSAMQAGLASDTHGKSGAAKSGTASDDLTRVEGIGPKIAELLRKSDITTFRVLSATPVEKLRKILDAGGVRFGTADPTTWPEQAGLADNREWDKLSTLQDELVGGRRPG